MPFIHTIYWPAHVWHDCSKYGCSPSEYNCLYCRGGLTACVVCGQAEGMIADYDKCPGPVSAETEARVRHLLRYHNEVAPLFRAAMQADYLDRKIRNGSWLPVYRPSEGWCDVIKLTCATGTGLYCDDIPGGRVGYREGPDAPTRPRLGVYDPYNAGACPTNSNMKE